MFNYSKKLAMAKQTLVARDSNGQVMWVKGRSDLSPMTYREWKESENMESGWVIAGNGTKYIPPFTIKEENI